MKSPRTWIGARLASCVFRGRFEILLCDVIDNRYRMKCCYCLLRTRQAGAHVVEALAGLNNGPQGWMRRKNLTIKRRNAWSRELCPTANCVRSRMSACCSKLQLQLQSAS